MLDGEKLASFLPGLSLHRVVVATSLFIVAYCGFTIAGNVARGYQLDDQTRQLQQSIAQDRGTYAQLDALRRYMRSDTFIDTEARREGLGIPGDTTIVVSAPPAATTPTPPPPGAWWERYYGN